MHGKFLTIEDNMLLAAPTLLDPRFKKIAFPDFGTAAMVTQYIIREIAASLRLDDSNSTDSTEVEVNVNVKDASPTDEEDCGIF